MFSNKEFFDFSEYDKDSKYFNENEGRNKGDSNSGICRCKSENVFDINKKGKEVKKAKGVSKSVVKDATSHANYINVFL